MPWVIVGIVVLAAVVVIAVIRSRRGPGAETAPGGVVSVESAGVRPAVAEFHVLEGAARVHFDVPLPEGPVDEVLADLLGREAVEVVREKRHSLPIDDVHRVVALGRRDGAWEVAATISLETPGSLPPPMVPELVPHAGRDFDVFERISGLPEQVPGIESRRRDEELPPFTAELRLPASAAAGLRAQGIDPAAAPAPEIVLGLMRMAGYGVEPTGADTYRAHRAGQTAFLRVVGHSPGSHPELGEQDIRRFVVDFGSSGAGRGMLLTEKYCPFEIYERERRNPRIRFVTRERLQAFVDALALG